MKWNWENLAFEPQSQNSTYSSLAIIMNRILKRNSDLGIKLHLFLQQRKKNLIKEKICFCFVISSKQAKNSYKELRKSIYLINYIEKTFLKNRRALKLFAQREQILIKFKLVLGNFFLISRN